MPHKKFMLRAIELSRTHMQNGAGGPFGAIIVKNGDIIAEGWNQVTSTCDPTAHAEIVAIRRAAEKLGDFSLSGCILYTSCQPCPMCLAACYWARIEKIYYANTAKNAADIEFDDSYIYSQIPLPPDKQSMPMEQILNEEALAVFAEWQVKAGKIRY